MSRACENSAKVLAPIRRQPVSLIYRSYFSEPLKNRRTSQEGASPSGRGRPGEICTALLGSPCFDPQKLTITHLPTSSPFRTDVLAGRKYTLTHSDITGQLRLSIGSDFNKAQLSGWYLQLIRDEVLAEWIVDERRDLQLHLFCHVSSHGNWQLPVPAALRSKIFQREMPLVLQTIKYADRALFSARPFLLQAEVFVHLSSHVKALDMHMEWGTLGDEQSWKQPSMAWFEFWRKRSATEQSTAIGLSCPAPSTQPPHTGLSKPRVSALVHSMPGGKVMDILPLETKQDQQSAADWQQERILLVDPFEGCNCELLKADFTGQEISRQQYEPKCKAEV